MFSITKFAVQSFDSIIFEVEFSEELEYSAQPTNNPKTQLKIANFFLIFISGFCR